jgi:cytochrome P450
MLHSFSDLRPFRRDALSFFLERGINSNRPLQRLHLGLAPIWLVTQAEIVKDLLRMSEDHLDKGRLIQKLRPIVGCSSLTMSGEEQRRRRNALHATFAKGVAQQFIPQMSAAIRQQAAVLAQTDCFDAHEVTGILTLRMISIVMFGHNVLSRGDEQALISAVGLVERDIERELFQVLPAPPWVAYRRRKNRALARLMLDAVVGRVRQKAASSSALSALADLQLSNDAIRDEIVTMLVAGHHTTGSAAVWLLYFLATEPGLADSLNEEARSISFAGELRAAELPKARRSLALVREVLRLYPPAHWFSREAKEDFEIGGQLVRRGDAVLFCPWLLHRHPRYWPDPDEFHLDRAFAGNAYLPFGAGPRACLGMGIAMLELQLLALEIASAFAIEVKSTVPAPPPTSSVTLVPPKILLSLSVRQDFRADAMAR